VTVVPEPELAARMQGLVDLPEGTVGRGLVDFYRRAGLTLPGVEGSAMNHWFVAHDTTHVIAGIEPTGPGEIALSAFQMAMDDNEVNRGALLASLVVHEAGFAGSESSMAEMGTLADPAAAELLGQEMERGAGCVADFSLADHMAMFERPLAEVREEFGVAAPSDPDDGHHCW
jgi:ubiquinone biosynthesis protein Coq4